MNGDNIFGIVGEAQQRLNRAGMREAGTRMWGEVQSCESYDDACAVVDRYMDALDNVESADAEWDAYWAECDAEEYA